MSCCCHAHGPGCHGEGWGFGYGPRHGYEYGYGPGREWVERPRRGPGREEWLRDLEARQAELEQELTSLRETVLRIREPGQ